MRTSRIIYTLCFFLCLVSCVRHDTKKYAIGVSQCSVDIWREKQNSELRVGTYFYDNVELRFAAAYDSDERQIQQIDSLVKTGINLLIVAPNQISTISPAIDRAYDSGIPVIVFERKTNSDKFTAYIGADNYEMGKMMGGYVASRLQGQGRILEIMGLRGSSPAIERHNGFADTLNTYPAISVVTTLQGDWTEDSAYRAAINYKGDFSDIDFVFAQNDRMALGVRRAILERGESIDHIRFCGIDGLPGEQGGISLVRNGVLDATYIYPTHGDKLLALAVNILENRPFNRINQLRSALVTSNNADILLMQDEEMLRRTAYLDNLHAKADTYLRQLRNQQTVSMLAVGMVVFILLTLFLILIYYRQKIRFGRERDALNKQKLDFYTRVSHELRTPLTLIEGPLEQLGKEKILAEADDQTANLFAVVRRNVNSLSILIKEMLQATAGESVNGLSVKQIDALTVNQLRHDVKSAASEHTRDAVSDVTDENEDMKRLLIVDDNPDIRFYLRSILQSRFRIYEADDGKQGLEVANRIIPDLIISDVMMPVMDGLEFCSHVKSNIAISHVPVILLTARAMSLHQVEGFNSGADGYITKPFSPDVLLALVDNLLRNRRLLRDIFSERKFSSDANETESQDDIFVHRFKEVVNARLSNSELSVEDIAVEMGMSRVQLYRKVKAMTGLSPNEQVRKARLLRARQMLVSKGRTVSEVAYAVGFSTPSYFSKCFKEEFGCLPGEI